MKKVLYGATIDIHIHSFHLPYLKWLKERGCEVHLAIENRGNLQLPSIGQLYYLSFPQSLLNFSKFSGLTTSCITILKSALQTPTKS